MNINEEIFYFINHDLANPFLDWIMPIFTDFGGSFTLLVVCILAVVITRYMKKEKAYETAKMCLFALVFCGVITLTLKMTLHEPRPYMVLDSVRQLTVPIDPNSFPSGHTSSIFSIVTVLVKKIWDEKLIVCLLIVYAAFIGFSRVYIGTHFPLDIVAGAAIGIVSGVVVLKLKKLVI